MRILESVITTIAPALAIPKRDWLVVWQAEERKRFVRTARYFSIGMAIVYVSHYFAVDLPVGKTPVELYRFYRFSIGLLGVATFALSYTRWFGRTTALKFPIFILGAYVVYMQAQSMVWRAQVPFFYVPLFASISALAFRFPVFGSVFVYATLLAFGKDGFFARPGEGYHVVSASIVAATLLAIFRSRMSSDLQAFISNQKHLELQKLLIENQLALTEAAARVSAQRDVPTC